MDRVILSKYDIQIANYILETIKQLSLETKNNDIAKELHIFMAAYKEQSHNNL